MIKKLKNKVESSKLDKDIDKKLKLKEGSKLDEAIDRREAQVMKSKKKSILGKH